MPETHYSSRNTQQCMKFCRTHNPAHPAVPEPQENEGGGKKGSNRAIHDLKQLSGGERSYTNVAFMLALGEYVEAPFRWGGGGMRAQLRSYGPLGGSHG